MSGPTCGPYCMRHSPPVGVFGRRIGGSQLGCCWLGSVRAEASVEGFCTQKT